MCRQVYNGTPVQPFKFWELVASSWMGTKITVSRFHLPLLWCQLFALRLRSSLVGLIVKLYIFFVSKQRTKTDFSNRWSQSSVHAWMLTGGPSVYRTRFGSSKLLFPITSLTPTKLSLYIWNEMICVYKCMYRWNSLCEIAQYIVAWAFTYSTMQFTLIKNEGKEA